MKYEPAPILLPPTVQIAGEEAIGRYLQLVGKGFEAFDKLAAEKPHIKRIDQGGGRFRTKVAEAPPAPPPKALRPRKPGIINIRRAR